MAAITLKRTAQKMPAIGFGLWKVTKSSCADTVYNAIKSGYRLLDGAGDYGNEKEAGEGLNRAIKDGLVKREEIFVTSKLWNTFHAHDHVKALARKQLDLWGIDYFDLFLVHFPIALKYVEPGHRYPPEWFGDDGKVYLQNTPFSETWGAMEELVDEGLVKNIGVSNTQGVLLLDILRYARYEPAVNQVELHPYLTQEPLIKLCKTLGIAITAYSSLGPQSYVELGGDKGAKNLLEHNVVTSIAQKNSKSTAQVLLRWAVQQGLAVIPKSNNHHRLVANLQVSDFTLPETDMKALSALNINLRLNDPSDMDPRLAIFA
ncbi:Probable NAD(P)H-dependent D-xylose reductase [Sparassis crispa]|uniref:Probable NAD(P)H-dependent D-xylose reductase n=1 Tax=Sparassis crispa TaxID=139825 RepID=A0A401G6I6_9APHY|nr:Probable NAD(P)H-dependent D-xylose reductase [Sparassis crispa]GBE77764.1 Probable NAD(P)H-dependent D-xylose reductase [Sparassis crispa]